MGKTSALRLTGVLVLALCLGLLPAQALAKYASIVIDAKTGQVLHAANADTRNFPASLAKMMTLYLAFDALDAGKLKLTQRLPVSAKAADQSPTKLGLQAGQTVAVGDCIRGLVVKSANDCAVVFAEALAGSEIQFARKMTERARQLGMTRTTFRNASGLPNAGQLSTARDMARLAQALIEDHPDHYHFFATESFEFRGTTLRSHNRLMARYEGMDGLKTGYIRASGFNLASSAERDGRRLIGVVFGGQTGAWRDAHMEELLDKAFAGRTTPVLMAAATPVRAPTATRQVAGVPIPARKPGTESPSLTGEVVTAVARAAETVAEGAAELSLVSTAVAATPAAGATGATGAIAAKAPPGWGIQIGAFADKPSSQQALASTTERFKGLLDDAVPHVVPVTTQRGTLFRARLMGLDERTARRACTQLAKAGKGCLTVPPQPAS